MTHLHAVKDTEPALLEPVPFTDDVHVILELLRRADLLDLVLSGLDDLSRALERKARPDEARGVRRAVAAVRAVTATPSVVAVDGPE